MEADGFVDLLVDLFAGGHVVRGEPAADAFVLEVGVETVGEILVFGGVADEAGVELDGLIEEGWEVGDEVFWEAAAAEEGQGSGPDSARVRWSSVLGPRCLHVSRPITSFSLVSPKTVS